MPDAQATVDAALLMRMFHVLRDVADYFDLERPPSDWDLPDHNTEAFNTAWSALLAAIHRNIHHADSFLDRIHRSAAYIESIEERRSEAREAEGDAKAAFLASLIEAVDPSLPAISEPLIGMRIFSPRAEEQRELIKGIRGIILLDGWKRGVREGEAGKSLVLLDAGGFATRDELGLEEDESLAILEHTAYESGQTISVLSKLRPCSIEKALATFSRKAFLEIVDKIVTTVWELARNPKRKAQIKESHALADKLQAVRVLLQVRTE